MENVSYEGWKERKLDILGVVNDLGREVHTISKTEGLVGKWVPACICSHCIIICNIHAKVKTLVNM